MAVTVEVGDWFDDRIVLGWALAQLERGERVDVPPGGFIEHVVVMKPLWGSSARWA